VASTWITFRAAVKAAFENAMPIAVRTATPVDWASGPRNHAGARVLLDVLSYVDEHVREATADDNLISSSNLVTVQVVCESPHDNPSASALWLVENVRLALRRESIKAALKAAGLAIVQFPLEPTRLPSQSGGRRMLSYVFDVTFRTTFELVPEADDAIGEIEHVEVSGEADHFGDELVIDEYTVSEP
jgi:hypothetical protein